MNTPHLASGGRYPVLRALAIMYLIMAALAVVGGLITCGYIFAATGWSIWTRAVWAIVSLAGTFFAVIGLLAIAEVFKLFMDLEHNTRVSAMANAYRGATTSDVAVTTSAVETAAVGPDGRRGRILAGEETAEGALVRGH